jgi:hypothetical protein
VTDALPQVDPAPPPALHAQSAAPPGGRIDLLAAAARANCAPPTDDEVVVCGSRTDPNRLHPLRPPPPTGFLSRPLNVRLAPGVTFGFLDGGGFGVRVPFGPGRKPDLP